MSDPGELDARELEELLLEGPRLFRRSAVAEESGTDTERSRKLWRALGFPDVPEQEEAFTEADVAALRRVTRLVRRGVFDDEFALGVTRAMGHHLSRLVEWEYVALAEHLTARDGLTPEEAGPAALATLAEHLLDLEALLLYVWRRQLVATAGRVLAGRDGTVSTRERTVGFADLVSYTRLAQRLSERELAALVDRFESLSADVIAAHGGRVVKTVGDEVLFLMPSPRTAADTALDLAETMAADPLVPDVRVGLASGLVLTRMGDVFGTVVNLASRLTAVA
ncbi:MAG: adenylate/guanylate cyclase domain-containing protein, partial [Actinomycetes bacterium]